MASSVARVVVNLSLDRAFDYRIPESLAGRVRVGARVRIPFGKAGGVRVGYVVGLSDHSAFPDLKEIVGVEGEREQITPSLVRLAEWIAQYYCCSKEQAVRAMLPAVVRQGKIGRKKQQTVRLAEGGNLAEAFPRLEKRAPKQAAALRLIVREHQVSLARLTRESGAGPDAVRRLVAQGLVEIEGQVVDRDPFADEEILPSQALALTPDQAAALSQIGDSMDRRDAGVILLHGVTGSGKTEVYLQAIARCLELGREAIVLVPEIALTPQTTERFRARFGNTVSVMHSALSDGERLDEWTRVREGRSRIAVGARSALFAPFTNLGLIVVDEEHETTYKQSESPRYNARDVAVVRGKFERATVVLGSATPALESYHNCQTGKYLLAELPTRIDGRLMPVMEVVDMRAEAALRGGAQIFSRRLESLIRDRLDHGSQTILFLNRRGYATQMICQKCGYVATCGQCSVTYTYHRHDGRLLCHLCGEVRPAPTACPQCGDADIRFSGLGTEKVEAITRRLFPHAAIARMDSDTMTARHAYRKTLNAFRTGRVHILIGTQMIAKGLDFPNVTLVGIIYADQALHINDFRAGERTFQLLTQVSGRAGRGDLPGHVVVQSYTPFHSALQHAVEHDYRSFAEEELEARRALIFPPVTHLCLVQFRGEDMAAVDEASQQLAAALKPELPPGGEIFGPMPAPVHRVRGQFRHQMLLRGGNILDMTRLLRRKVVGVKPPKGVEIHLDIDPQSMF